MDVGHPLYRLATSPPQKTRTPEVLRWLANEDPLVPPAGFDAALASYQEIFKRSNGSDLLEAADELGYLRNSGGAVDEAAVGWICASWLARRALPLWLDFLGMIGPAHALVSTQPVREADRSVAVLAAQVKAARLQVETALDELLGAPAWRGPHEPVAAAIEVEAQYALRRTGEQAALELSSAAGKPARRLAEMAVEASRQAICTAGHLVADSLLKIRGALDPAGLAEVQHAVRCAIYVPALRLEHAAPSVLGTTARDEREPDRGRTSGQRPLAP